MKGDKVKRVNGDDHSEKNMYKGTIYTTKKDEDDVMGIELEEASGQWESSYFELVALATKDDIKQEAKKMKPAETKFEKVALQEAKKKQIEIEITRKAECFKNEIQNWISYEKSARDYRAKADILAKELNLTKEEMNDLL